ncbi:flagellar basal body-associated FliL family protein [Treponema primitia]|uniref:flagellar basal body-associated FliL family protein n=1 Tax=Treponema primitia TaxID=88058 RepID=UPI0039805274
MGDGDDILDEGGEAQDSGGGGSKKPGGLGALLPNLLKFVAIGLGALIFIITVTVITFNFMNKGGPSQTVVADSSSPYNGKRPEYLYFNSIGTVRCRTKDPTSHSVVVDLAIGYDMNDKNAATELTTRLYELQDFVRNFFSSKYARDLATENEARLKQEIIEALNTKVLNSSKAKNIVFKQLDVVEL